MKHCIIIILLSFCMCIMGQVSREITAEIIHLHTDKDYYAIGDTVRFTADLIDGETGMMSTDRDYPTGRSNFVYVELHDAQADTLVARYMVKKDSVGNFANSFILPLRLSSGHYTMVAYTRYMMNFNVDFFAYRDIYVQGVKGCENIVGHKVILPLSVVVHPEGGVLLRDNMQCVAYSVRDAKGIGTEAEVCISDAATDSVIVNGKTEVDGMGRLYFVPEAGKSYRLTARTADNILTEVNLPEVKEKGATVKISRRKNFVYIEPLLAGCTIDDIELLILSGNSRRAVTFGSIGYAMLDTTQLPKGLIKLEIRNKATQETMAERIFYQR